MNQLFLSWLEPLNIPEHLESLLAGGVLVAALLILAFLANWIGRLIIRIFLQKAVRRSKHSWDDILYDRGVFRRLSLYLPAVALYLLLPVFFPEVNTVTEFVRRVIIAWMTGVTVLLLDSFLESVNSIYQAFGAEKAKRKPIKGYLQMIKIFAYIVGVVLIVTTIMNVSPVGILSGIGAMSAVLLLVFKDSIMGLVSSMQLAGNDMVRIGDWIEMPKYGANGDVIDITLQSIKVQNWDMTVTTIPIYALISDSFKNWRGMSESGGRRVQRALSVDMRSVTFLTPELLTRLKKLRLLKDYLEAREKDISEHNARLGLDPEDMVSGRKLTNLGTFRAYVSAYISEHPMLNRDMTHMVRYLEPGPKGIPVEIYFFCSDKAWVTYEGVQADIFDHLLAVLPEFDLRVFQEPSGWDLQSIAETMEH